MHSDGLKEPCIRWVHWGGGDRHARSEAVDISLLVHRLSASYARCAARRDSLTCLLQLRFTKFGFGFCENIAR